MINESKFSFDKTILKYQSSIGILEFRYISHQDIVVLQRLDKSLADKDFSVLTLFNQLETKKLYSEFSGLPENELKEIISKYIEKSILLNYHYSKMDSEDAFLKFKKSIRLHLEESLKKISAMLKATTEWRESFANAVRKMVFPKVNLRKFILPDLSKQLEFLSNTFLKVIQNQSKGWLDFAVEYKRVSKKSLKNLKKYNWFINSSMPGTFLAETAKAKNAKDMKRLFILYHIDDNFSTLNYYNSSWCKKPLFKKRMKILRDTINLFKNNYKNKDININNVIIPVLINQIEGIKHDYMKSKGFLKLSKTSYQNPDTNETISWTSVLQDSLKYEDDFSKLIGVVFVKILFQKDGENAPITNFSRHKISHGKILKYGTVETSVRCFMTLEFLSELK